MTLEFNSWWFCSEPGIEEMRFHTDPRTLKPNGVTLSCKHGQWSGTDDSVLSTARSFHGYTFDPPANPSIGPA